MAEPHVEYWLEALEYAMDALGVLGALTDEQRREVARSLCISAENQSLAFYNPPASDRIASVEREKAAALAQERAENERVLANVRAVLARQMGVRTSDLSIGHDGRVFLNGGRTVEIYP